MVNRAGISVFFLTIALGASAPVAAQSSVSGLPWPELRSALQQRMNSAIAIATSNEARRGQGYEFDMAVEAKNQCGIAFGFSKMHTRDAASIAACEALTAKLSGQPS
jgi:hypothetical protein